MKKTRFPILILLLTLALLLCGCGTEKPSEPPAEQSAVSSSAFLSPEEIRDCRKAMLDKEDLKDKEILVIGHKSPDTDTVGSAIAMAELLRQLGYKAEARVTDKLSNETKYVLEQCGYEAPAVLENAEGKTLFLVDHNDTVNAVNGADKATVVGIIDHHTVLDNTDSPIFVETRLTGACATEIALNYALFGVTPDAKTAKLLALTILADTSNFANAEVTEADHILFEKLCGIAGLSLTAADTAGSSATASAPAVVSDIPAIWAAMSAAKKSYDGMTTEEIFYSDYKEYDVNGFRYCVAYMRGTGEEELRSRADEMYRYMEDTVASSGLDLMLVQVADRDLDVCLVRAVGSGAVDLCRKAYASDAQFDGTYFRFSPSVSRKTVLAPKLNEVLGQ